MKKTKNKRTKSLSLYLNEEEEKKLDELYGKMSKHKNLSTFQDALQKEKITMVIGQNKGGFVYGLTYIDHTSGCVFNDSDLDKNYSAKSIIEKCRQDQVQSEQLEFKTNQMLQHQFTQSGTTQKNEALNLQPSLETLLSPIEQYNPLQYPYKKPKRRKRKSS